MSVLGCPKEILGGTVLIAPQLICNAPEADQSFQAKISLHRQNQIRHSPPNHFPPLLQNQQRRKQRRQDCIESDDTHADWFRVPLEEI